MTLFICGIAAVLILMVASKLLRMDKRERGDDDDGGWGRGKGPDDWPKLPRPPSGGPIDSGDFKLWETEMEAVKPRVLEVVVIVEPEEEE